MKSTKYTALYERLSRDDDNQGESNSITGLLYCADCGGKLYVHRYNNGKRISQYTCSQYAKIPCGTLCKSQHRINESDVMTLISDILKAIRLKFNRYSA